MGILPMFRGDSGAAFGEREDFEAWAGVGERFTGWKPALRG